MSFVVRFQSDFFDVSQETQNPLNDIPGESLLLWLRKQLKDDFNIEVSEPDAEDWGWYSQALSEGRSYMLGASASASDEEGAGQEWVLQIVKDRTIVEKLLGKSKMTPDEAILTKVMSCLAKEPAFRGLSID